RVSFIIVLLHPSPLPETYTLSLHDALPIYRGSRQIFRVHRQDGPAGRAECAPQRRTAREPYQVAGLAAGSACAAGVSAGHAWHQDRKSTRLNSSHVKISYAVFCLKKKIETK